MKLIYKIIILLLFVFIPIGFGSPIFLREIKWIIPDIVTATIYNKGLQTASGIWLDRINPKKHRIIAISRDLFGKYNFGDSVLIIGTNIYDGIYYVEDLMHMKWSKKIDILINPNDKINKFYKIKIFKL